MSYLDQRIRDKLLRQGHDIGMLHRGLAAVLDACKELDEFGAETYSDAAAFRVRESLAYALGVSGEDRSEPTPAPREFRAGDTEPPVGTKLAGGSFTWTRHGKSWQTPEGGVLNWAQLTEFCPRLVEVVTPEGTP